jgi:hypothetical protein
VASSTLPSANAFSVATSALTVSASIGPMTTCVAVGVDATNVITVPLKVIVSLTDGWRLNWMLPMLLRPDAEFPSAPVSWS